ncbi:Uncharacterised protein [Listeria ivanovii subsp. londoniensis]|uniref:Uncharacterized protein n=1 Tax=Listeria ivanovii TaxID=1638 RepID=A0AAX2DKK9_LISIV|nr:hypothetical protein SAMN05421782_10192 [Listeria ivanovii]VEH48465.1 Uncharacterised protein [Listeria ivanovii subsp. londoniensis]
MLDTLKLSGKMKNHMILEVNMYKYNSVCSIKFKKQQKYTENLTYKEKYLEYLASNY